MDNLFNNMDVKKDVDYREIFTLTFELLKTAEESPNLYFDMAQNKSAQQLIILYYKYFKTNYETMIYNFKKKYIENEAKVEYNDEDKKLELKGISYMYDYIQNFKANDKDFDIFVEGLKLHQLLYKAFDDKFNSDQESIKQDLENQIEKAKKEKNLQEYKRLLEIRRRGSTPKKFGGNLRDHEVDLKDVDYHVPTCKEAKAFFNEFIKPEKKIEYQNILSSTDILKYIEYCVKISVDIIKNQPFSNGNKRTSRALLNLMFKNKNIPPVYITFKERNAYKNALIKAMTNNDYTDITNFYYFKICDSIYELDIKGEIKNEKEITDDSDMKFYNFRGR